LWAIGMMVALLTTALLIVNLRPEIWKGLLEERILTLIAIGVSVTAIIVLLAIGGAASSWTGFRGMTVRDWLDLLVVPLALVVISFLFTVQQDQRQQRTENERSEAERELAEQRAQDEALQAYLGQMNQLLLEKNLRDSERASEVRILARARTLTTLGTINADHRISLFQFLYEADLINSPKPVVNLDGANLQGVDLRGSDLSGGPFGPYDLQGFRDLCVTRSEAADQGFFPPYYGGCDKGEGYIEYSLSDLHGITLRGASLRGADLSWTVLAKGNLLNAELGDANLRQALLTEAELSGADLRNADLRDANLAGARVTLADLSEADLRSADLDHANLSDADLIRTNLSGADLSDADLSAAHLAGANLSEADLSGADLIRTNLSGGDLSDADLREANLREANLSFASLSGADLSEAKGWTKEQLLAADSLKGTTMPNGQMY
jgi:uncharacterized protein YjbI with pentapeptide repeats